MKRNFRLISINKKNVYMSKIFQHKEVTNTVVDKRWFAKSIIKEI